MCEGDVRADPTIAFDGEIGLNSGVAFIISDALERVFDIEDWHLDKLSALKSNNWWLTGLALKPDGL